MSFLLRNFLFYIFPKKRMINVRVCVRIQMMNVFFLICFCNAEGGETEKWIMNMESVRQQLLFYGF